MSIKKKLRRNRQKLACLREENLLMRASIAKIRDFLHKDGNQTYEAGAWGQDVCAYMVGLVERYEEMSGVPKQGAAALAGLVGTVCPKPEQNP